MSTRKYVFENSFRIFGIAVLPLAVSMAFFSSPAHASPETDWQPTTTHAAIERAASTSASMAASPAISRFVAPVTWAVNVHGMPEVIDDAAITPLEANKQLNLTISLKLRNEDKLTAFLRDLNTPGSASYHKYLTPAEFKAAFGPTEQQTEAVVAHLQKNGFSNISIAPNNLLITAKGNSSNIQAAFNTAIKQFNSDGKQYYANDSDAQVPQSLNGIVTAVLGLQNISGHHVMSHPVPLVTTGINIAHSPTAYPSIYHAGNTPTAYATSVAVIGWNDQTQTQADLTQFTTANLLDPVDFKIIKVPSDADFPVGSEGGEWSLDTQTIVGVSGGVKQMLFYTAPTASNSEMTAAENQAVSDDIAKIINCSYGSDEEDLADGSQTADDAVFAQAVAQGQIFSVASGDSGVYQWSKGSISSGFIGPHTDLTHYSVSQPTSSPYVVSVGGTELITSPTDSTVRVDETVWNDGAPAVITDEGFTLYATGGGISAFESAPPWQVAVLGNQVTHRMLPDLAFNARSGVAIVGGVPQALEGTSLASPIFVGAFARIETAANNSIGLPTSDMYRDFSKPENAGLLHDVTSGNNGYNGYGYFAAKGWDATTGWGSFDIEKLSNFAVANWGDGSAPPAPPTPRTPPPVTALQNGSTGIAQGTPGSSQQFTVDVPAGARALNVRTLGGSGDVTLYVKFGAAASAADHDFVSAHLSSNNESVTVGKPQAGTYYITVSSPVTFVDVVVGARYVAP